MKARSFVVEGLCCLTVFAIAFVVLSLAVASDAWAAEHPLAGDSLRLQDLDGRRRGAFRAVADPAIDPAMAADPTRVGATLEVTGAGPGFGSTGQIFLGSRFWQPLGDPPGSRGYKYVDRAAAVGVKTVVFQGGQRGGKLSFSAGGEQWPFAFAQPQQAASIRFTVGGEAYCALFSPPTFTRNQPGRLSAKNALAPANCARPMCGNGTLEAGEECDDGNLAAGDCCSTLCTVDPDGTTCDDGMFCSAVDTCRAGACVGSGHSCDDGVGCTSDPCDEPTDRCTHTPVDSACDDRSFCTGQETCNRYLDCQPGTPPLPDCSYLDDGECLVGVCSDTARACVAEPIEGEECSPADLRGESPSPLPVVIRWTEDVSAGPVRTSGPLLAALENRTDETIAVKVSLTAMGLDQRTRQLVVLAPTSLRARRSKALRIDFDSLPIQSVGSLTSVELQAELVRDDGSSVVISSEPRYVEFDPDYEMATVHGPTTAYSEFSSRETDDIDAFFAKWGELNQDLFDLRGRIVDDDGGRLVDIGVLRASEPAVDWQAGGTMMVRQVSGGRLSMHSLIESLPLFEFEPLGPARRVCAHWPAQYVDAGFGEDYLTAKYVQPVPARFARVVLTRVEPVADECDAEVCLKTVHRRAEVQYLDADGCLEENLSPGKYTLTLWPIMLADAMDLYGDYQRPLNCEYPPYPSCQTDDDCSGVAEDCKALFINYGNFLVMGFSIYPPLSPLPSNPYLVPSLHDSLTRVMGVMSQIAATADNGLVEQYPEFRVHADQQCAPSSSSCARLGDLYIGAPLPGEAQGLHDSYWKFITAHEFGHIEQGKVGTKPGFDPSYSLPIMPAPAPLCRCDHVVSANKLHCLQSLGLGGNAQIEGWAQFYAAKVFNNASHNDCRFVYYKEFKKADGTVLPVPNVHDCRNPARWWHTHCHYAESAHTEFDIGTELDWMVFLWNVKTVGPYKSSFDDLREVFSRACDGMCFGVDGPCCGGVGDARWAELQLKAIEYWGLDAPESLFADHFITSGNDAGVDP